MWGRASAKKHETPSSHDRTVFQRQRSTTNRVTTDDGVGEMGETLHRRDNEAAAATGLGMKTTDHQKSDGVSLTTLAGGP